MTCPRCSANEGGLLTKLITEAPDGTKTMGCSGGHHSWKEDKEGKIIPESIKILG
jgi:hypothetical protein